MADVQLTCSSLAFMFCSWAIDFTDRKKNSAAAMFCAIASLFQVLFGLQLMGLLLLVVLLFSNDKKERKWKTGLMMVLAYTLPAAFILIPLFKQQMVTTSQPELYHALLFVFRNAHHYLPQCFPASDYLKTMALWGLAGVCLHHCDDSFKILFRLLSGAVILSCIVYVMLFSLFGLSAIGKLQVFKSTVFISYIALVPIVMAAGSAASGSKFPVSLRRTSLPLSISIILFLFNTNSRYLPDGRWQGRYKVGNYTPDHLEQMHLWIRENTPKDAVFVSFASDGSFLCEARRSLVVAYKGIIHSPEFMIPWYEKMQAVYRVPILENSCRQNVLARADSSYAAMPDSLIDLRFRFRLWKNEPLPGSGPEIHRVGSYVLTGNTE